MKILLLNNNSVVDKLVTLSVQKTSDELKKADNIEDVEFENYDLLIVDDALCNEEVIQTINNNLEFSKSLYIYSKTAKAVEGFDKTLKKPFLPADLMDILKSLAQEIDAPENGRFDDIEEIDDLTDLNEYFELEELEDDSNESEEIYRFEDLELYEEATGGVLDKNEIQKIQNLLDEAKAADNAYSELCEEDLEAQIESAIQELSEKELESEVDDYLLLDLDSLTDRDLKFVTDRVKKSAEVKHSRENQNNTDFAQTISNTTEFENEENSSGVEALKKLLKALSNEDVSASLKGMKININITLGDKQ